MPAVEVKYREENCNNLNEGQIIRSSLGRTGFIGELYDVRSESFSSRSLLKSSHQKLIRHQDVGLMEFDYSFTESHSDVFELLKVEGELQMSVLLGLISVEGSGKFLSEEKNLNRSVSCTLVCDMRIAREKFFAPFSEILHHIDLDALENDNYTHVITEVSWGGKCLLTLTGDYKSEKKKTELKGMLSAEMSKLKKFLSGKCGGKGMKNNLSENKLEEVRIKVRADVVPEGEWPTTIEGFSQFVQDIPRFLKKLNNGKGNPMSFVMTPLDAFRKAAKMETAVKYFVKAIDESFIMSTVFLFDDIGELKRKLSHLNMDLSSMSNHVTDENLKEAKEQESSLACKESQLKQVISENWVLVKSGEKSVRELLGIVEKFKSRTLNLCSYETYLESALKIQKHLERVTYLTSLGIFYMGKSDSLEDIMSKHLSCDLYVLVASSKTREENEDIDLCTLDYFISEASNPKPNTKYVVMDLDIQKRDYFLKYKIVTTRFFHLKGSRVLSSDKFADYVAEMECNFLRPAVDSPEYLRHKPSNRVPLEMVCPGFNSGTCSHESVKWTCFRCKHSVEYDCKDHFYCKCGKIEVKNIEYRCSDLKHGDCFVKGNMDFIRKQLQLMRHLKEMNVLVIGQSGVGKSTWINSIINYLSFDSMESAQEGGFICTIPMSVDIYDINLGHRMINIGEENENENTMCGQSATQFPCTYTFNWNGRCVRIIDTPGLGDTRGIEQDKKNLSYIIDHIDHLTEVHGICILLKASDNRLNSIFSYCFKELIIHLHRAAIKNVVFCFTNARATRYAPGKNFTMLRSLIEKLGVTEELPLAKNNLFFLENEAFLFLCSLNHPEVTYTDDLIESLSKSWQISSKETKRLFETISTFEPHDLKQTTSLVSIRRRIMTLSKPIADITLLIQTNLTLMRRLEAEAKNLEMSLDELSKKLNYIEFELLSEPLHYPRTVCTQQSCVEYLSLSNTNIRQINYKTICHKHCYLENVQCDTINNSMLRGCEAMSSNGVCLICSCSWDKHMHITYSQKRVTKVVVDKTIEQEIERDTSEKNRKEKLMADLKDKINRYKQEQDFITKVSVTFGMFLRINSISTYNDSVADYMDLLIQEEERKPEKTEDDKACIQNLKDMLRHYHAEVDVLKKVLDQSKYAEENLTVEKITELEKKLYELELTGDSISQCVRCERAKYETLKGYSEVSVACENAEKKEKTKMNVLKKIIKKCRFSLQQN